MNLTDLQKKKKIKECVIIKLLASQVSLPLWQNYELFLYKVLIKYTIKHTWEAYKSILLILK